MLKKVSFTLFSAALFFLFASGATLAGMTWWRRMNFPYDLNGEYVNAAGEVINENTVDALGILFALLCIITLLFAKILKVRIRDIVQKT